MSTYEFGWRGRFDNSEVNRLHGDAFSHDPFADDWRTQVARQSLGWVTARAAGHLVGFANVVWDGGIHAWLQDVMVSSDHQRSGVGRAMVQLATAEARRAGCEWLHVDFDEEHRPFYINACGFTPTAAGLISL